MMERIPYVPGLLPGEGRRTVAPHVTTIEPVLGVTTHPIEIIRWVFAIIRDLLLIVIMVIVLIVGHRIVTGINDLRQQVGTFNTPAGATLPVDKCGGGVC